MPVIATSLGKIDYSDTAGHGPTVVRLPGLLQDVTVWSALVDQLRDDHRCIVAVLPQGAHRHPVPDDADLSPASVAGLIGELLDRLELQDVTLVENDSGRLQQLLAQQPHHPRIGRCVIASCEAFDNYPPGLPGRTVTLAAKVPGGIRMLAIPMRVRAIRRLPFLGP